MRLKIKTLEQERPVILSICGLELTIDEMEKEEEITIVADDRGVVIHDTAVEADRPKTSAIPSMAHKSTTTERSREDTSMDKPKEAPTPNRSARDSTVLHGSVIHTSGTHATISEDDLFRKLATLRKQLAEEQRVPPYVIFNDKSLKEMVQKLPEDLASFRSISGVGERKLEKYGSLFLDTIRTYQGTIAS